MLVMYAYCLQSLFQALDLQSVGNMYVVLTHFKEFKFGETTVSMKYCVVSNCGPGGGAKTQFLRGSHNLKYQNAKF